MTLILTTILVVAVIVVGLPTLVVLHSKLLKHLRATSEKAKKAELLDQVDQEIAELTTHEKKERYDTSARTGQ